MSEDKRRCPGCNEPYTKHTYVDQTETGCHAEYMDWQSIALAYCTVTKRNYA